MHVWIPILLCVSECTIVLVCCGICLYAYRFNYRSARCRQAEKQSQIGCLKHNHSVWFDITSNMHEWITTTALHMHLFLQVMVIKLAFFISLCENCQRFICTTTRLVQQLLKWIKKKVYNDGFILVGNLIIHAFTVQTRQQVLSCPAQVRLSAVRGW